MDDNEREALLKAEREARVAKSQELYRRLHACKKLTENKRFQPYGNGLGSLYDNQLVMWFSDTRSEGQPNKRTKKSEVGTFLQQDAVDALIAFANIAEKVAPYVWATNPHPEAPESGWVGSNKEGNHALVNETALFLDRFGLPHMRSDGEGPGTRKNPLHVDKLRFTDSFEKDHESEMEGLHKFFKAANSELVYDIHKQRLKEHGLLVEGNDKETASRIFHDELRSFAKDFSSYSGFDKERTALLKEQARLEELAKAACKKNRTTEENNYYNKIMQLHMEKGTLIQACEDAYRMFSDEERKSITTEGLALPDIWGMYEIGLLFHDAIELHLAIMGDKAAFKRVLTKIHMELFDIESATALKDDADPSTAEYAAEDCYTIWFESCGSDPDNPGTNMDRDVYETELYGVQLKLRRKKNRWEETERYGCGRVVHQLCKTYETPDNFKDLAHKYLPVFLNGLIEEGLSRNYKGLFAEPAIIDEKNPIITVNDFNSDLVRTLWHVMDLVSKGAVPLNISRCKCCGRLINTAKEAGHTREYCDSSCRSLHHKRVAVQEKSGKEHIDTKVRREFLEYMESGQAINVGMISHMGSEMQPVQEAEKRSIAEALLQMLPFRAG